MLQRLPVISAREDSSIPILTDDQLGSPLTEEELKIAISQLNNGKAPGKDGITAEILRLGLESLVQWLKHLADHEWSEEAVHKDWKKSLLIPLHRKDTRTVHVKYLGISLLSIPSKQGHLQNRLQPC